jgi:hypothetical protein
MDKKSLIQGITFGESIAEQEAKKLRAYFLQTEFWRNIRNGTNDIVYGDKGSGKSAIYTSITNDIDSLFDEGILLAIAENPSGNTAFANLKSDPPTSKTEFVRLWKLYFLVIGLSVLDDFGIDDEPSNKVREILRDCNLVPAQNKLSSFLKACYDFAKSFTTGAKEVSTTAEFDSITGAYSGQKFSVVFNDPSKSDFDKGLVPVEYVYELLVESLRLNGVKLWIIIDRLDVAFVDSEELEINALKSLFKVYLDLAKFEDLKIKIFLRNDIWDNITNDGFREASHITKFQRISWNKEALLNVIIRRLLDNEKVVQVFNLDKNLILSNINEQEKLFYRFFPKQVDIGSKKPATLDWILSRTRDGKNINTPREIIQMLNYARLIEIQKLENGINDLYDDVIISRQSLKDSLENVSKQRIEQTLYAEYPNLKKYIELLRNDKAEHNLDTLSVKWAIEIKESQIIIKKLCDIGFFEEKGTVPNIKYKIPFMYRPYLDIIQGIATTEDEE